MQIEERVESLENKMSTIENDLAETVRFQRENTKNLGTLITETKEIVALHRDLQGVVKVGTQVQRFAVWFLKLATALSGIYVLIEHLR